MKMKKLSMMTMTPMKGVTVAMMVTVVKLIP